MTPSTLKQAIGCSAQRADIWAPFLTEAMGMFAIDTPARQAAFLAQIGHESGQLAHVREIWGPLPSQLRYEGRADLGNTQKGDGVRYKGRGLIQITGRANYTACAKALDLPLVDHPYLLEVAGNACRSAAWFWQSRNLNELADAGDFLRITRRINGGTNGLEDRKAYYEKANRVLKGAS